MEKDADKFCKTCYGCQLVSRPHHVEPNGITVLRNGRVTRSGIFFYEIQSDGFRRSFCFKDLQHLEQEGEVASNL